MRRKVMAAVLLVGLMVAVVLVYSRPNGRRLDGRYETSTPGVFADVIYWPTPQDVVDKMLELAQVKQDDVLYDLGCGDGRIVVTAAQTFGCRAVGFEIDPEFVKKSRERVVLTQVENLVTIEERDIFTLDLSEADVVTLYLLDNLNDRLLPQLEKLKPGSRIVSHNSDIQGIEPDQVIDFLSKDDNTSHVIYLWTTPLRHSE